MSAAINLSFTLGLKDLLVGDVDVDRTVCECLYAVGDCGIIEHISHFKVWIDSFICQMVNAVQFLIRVLSKARKT